MAAKYEHDTYTWAHEQAALLRAHQVEELDFVNLAEEIESMGKSERRALLSQLTRLLAHVLKWEHQPERRSRSWALTIDDAQVKVERLLDDNPSLRSGIDALLSQAYEDGRRKASIDTRLAITSFAERCPYAFATLIAFDVSDIYE